MTVVSLLSCYEDKGNYDYNDLIKITLDIGEVKDITLGDVLKVTPTITLSKDIPNLQLAYKWILEGDVISTERDLDWVADRYTEESSDNLIFEVTDLDNDIQYRVAKSFSIKGKYEVDGYLVLADKGGKKYLHLLYMSSDENGDEIYVPLIDVFGLENNGEAIPANSFKFFEHYCRQGNDYKNQIMLIANDQTFEIEGSSFNKVDNTLQDMFNGVIPSDLQNSVKDVFFMQRLGFITDTKGQLYSRVKSTYEFFSFRIFLEYPRFF